MSETHSARRTADLSVTAVALTMTVREVELLRASCRVGLTHVESFLSYSSNAADCSRWLGVGHGSGMDATCCASISALPVALELGGTCLATGHPLPLALFSLPQPLSPTPIRRHPALAVGVLPL